MKLRNRLVPEIAVGRARMYMMLRYLLLIYSLLMFAMPHAYAQNYVLSLDGDGDYVEIADSESLNMGSQVTVEVWISVREYANVWVPIIYKGGGTNGEERSYVLWLKSDGSVFLNSAPDGWGNRYLYIGTAKYLVTPGAWTHIAGVVDGKDKTMRIYINGAEVVHGNFGEGIHISDRPLRIGWMHGESTWASPFAGQIDELSIWNVARTQEEIRATMYSALSGKEPGLVGYWRFDNPGSPSARIKPWKSLSKADEDKGGVVDLSPTSSHGKLMGDAHFAESILPMPDELVVPTVLSGAITDKIGKPVSNATVRLEHDDAEVRQEQANDSGQYLMAFYPTHKSYDLSAVAGTLGGWQFGVQLREGEHQKVDMALKEAVSIEGTLVMLDDTTPHVAVPVQAMRDGKLIATELSDDSGRYRLFNLKPGTYQLRCQVLGGYVYYQAAGHASRFEESAIGTGAVKTLRVELGRTLKKIDFRFARFKRGTWRNYTSLDGLAHEWVNCIHCDPNGVIWFGTNAGISRYDGQEFVNLTKRDGLVDNYINSIYRDPDGVMWFGAGNIGEKDGGVSRYDGSEFVNFTTRDGLIGGAVTSVHRGLDGVMWFGTWGGGVSRYDDVVWTSLDTRDGLASNYVNAIHQDEDAVMWFGTNGGASRYDGKEFVNFTISDGLANNSVLAIHRGHDGVIWFGTEGGISRYDGKVFANLSTKDGLVNDKVEAIHGGQDGVVWFGTYDIPTESGGVSRYDGTSFVNFTAADGLAHNMVAAIHRDPDGIIWFGTRRGGISRYDQEAFLNFTTRDGLVGNWIRDIHRCPDGAMWIGTTSGVSRYDGREFVNFTTRDGLVHNNLKRLHGDSDGVMWFGTVGGGVSRYDGKTFINFTSEDGLGSNAVEDIHRAPDGAIWFGTTGGVCRYDGKEFINFTTEDGLAHNNTNRIHRGQDGIMWIGTWGGGVSRYDGKTFVNLTIEDGLPDDIVGPICGTPDGMIWFGTERGGVSRYDGKTFTNFSKEDGLANNTLRDIHCDPNSVMWFGTWGGGVSRYDGVVWTSLDTRDGLASNYVNAIHQDEDGTLWFATSKGLTRYRRPVTPPKVRIASVTTDQTYLDLSAIPDFTLGTRITIEYVAIDLKTIPEKWQYRYRIYGKLGNEDGTSQVYSPPTEKTAFDWIARKSGTYVFEVQAIDRDANHSEPASLELMILPPAFYRRAWVIISVIMILFVTLTIVSIAYLKHRRQVRAYERSAVEELENAKEMQISLLPVSAPSVRGMDIAGKSTTANTVGGDFFDYITLANGKVGIAIGDVSGKGLKAAMNAVLTSGMLYEVVKTVVSCGSILSVINAGLYPRTERQMFTAFAFAILDQDSGVIQWSNAAQPHPIVKRGSVTSEADENGQLPLGMAPDVKYPNYKLKLQLGDIIIFYTDGIIEAENKSEEMYGTERLLDTVAGIDTSASSEDVIEAILRDVAQFVGDAEQYDDITVVALRKI